MTDIPSAWADRTGRRVRGEVRAQRDSRDAHHADNKIREKEPDGG